MYAKTQILPLFPKWWLRDFLTFSNIVDFIFGHTDRRTWSIDLRFNVLVLGFKAYYTLFGETIKTALFCGKTVKQRITFTFKAIFEKIR